MKPMPTTGSMLLLLALVPGAAATTVKKIAELNPRGGASMAFPPVVASWNDLFFFSATDGVNGEELWRSDGTAQGSVLVKDVNPGAGDSAIARPTPANGRLYFVADDGVHGLELWSSDGTAQGTALVDDVFPGPQGADPQELLAIGATLFFSANDGLAGRELWKTDGTPQGTARVKDLAAGLPSSTPTALTELNGKVFFFANDFVNGNEPWISDGTEQGTTLVKDVMQGAESSFVVIFAARPAAANGVLCFSLDDGSGFEPWRSDGTAAGTFRLADVHPTGSSAPASMTAAGGRVYFVANDGGSGKELWATDGTSGGTALVADLNPNGGANPASLTAFGDRLFFTADDGATGKEPWITDGTPGGTLPLGDLQPGRNGSLSALFPTAAAARGDTVVFFANDGATGVEPWETDGTAGGTRRIADVNPGGDAVQALTALAHARGNLLFAAQDGTGGLEPWLTGPFVPYGKGCTGSGGFVPALELSGDSARGTLLNVAISGGLGGTTCLLFISPLHASIKVQGGCIAHLVPFEPIVLPLFGVGPGNGAIAFSGLVPVGTPPHTGFTQVFVLDPNAGPNHGYCATNAVQYTVQ